MNEIDQRYQGKGALAKLFFTGLGMGAANIIPGVSGGTIAFLFGIYEDLIASISHFNIGLLRGLTRKGFGPTLQALPWRFLAALFAGVFIAIFSLANLMEWLLVEQRVWTFAFFFGLILATAPVIGRNIRVWNTGLIVLGVATAAIMYWVGGLLPMTTPDSWWFLFFCGAVAVCTMILPGISGSFILLILGKYQDIIRAVSERDLMPIVMVGLGCVCGLLAFVRVLNWLLHRHHDRTMIVLCGLVLGSLRRIWPWSETISTITTAKGEVMPVEQINVWPPLNGELLIALALCALGFWLAIALSERGEKAGPA